MASPPSDTGIAARYRCFAREEAHGQSPSYEALALQIAADADVIGFLTTLPPAKQQPNLLLAAMRHLFGVAPHGTPDWPRFRHSLLANPEAVRSVMLSHATQTNEPARCATLLPVLAQLPQPLALIEVGASAGLCLLPDFYGYDYGGHRIAPLHTSPGHPVFTCQPSRTTPLPRSMPRIVWRAGLDLDPVDAADPLQAAWLQTLVWPEQTQRRANLQAALAIAAREKPPFVKPPTVTPHVATPWIVRGDLRGEALGQLCRQAPKHATLVIFHTAVVAYLEQQAECQAFAERMATLCDFWLSNESPRVFPRIARDLDPAPAPGCFLLAVNNIPVAWTGPHGQTIDWIAGPTLAIPPNPRPPDPRPPDPGPPASRGLDSMA